MANRGNIPCEVPGCGGTRAQGYLLCSPCWRAVPRRLQSCVYSSFRAWQAVLTQKPADMPAMREASASYRAAAKAATDAACANRFPDLHQAMKEA
ncbi:hypothetical protein [Niveispirillum cyanobacteriorum]|uniref:Uncharacterized protein n=1 Tax=Niveispirillum cyanobacteriorum TaxID=1612173 RepID=A0A2K9NDU8_9PROT|nr:hypothetical protein [Niveispirillum cyanobacteriorum]AUN31267.1 hypothetical protein C0V82_14245 [Niveispirillum cyanobacteriorum]GGE72786.1 hypothetical protein GCM10011317_32540 [Niveispirillum cyanobacteriorum]